MDEQRKFQENDNSSDEPFTNVTDKGYRNVLAAWRKGQFLLQPTFARSDRHFTTFELLSSASIARDRAGNERAVNVCKRAGYIRRGLEKNQSAADLADAWLAWSFQVNFMYRPIL